MPDSYFPLPGVQIDPRTLAVRKARELADFLTSGVHPWARLVEARSHVDSEPAETVVLDVEIGIGQEPRHDIHPTERLSVTFHASDCNWPEVLALRADFPRIVPHLFPSRDTEACRLCLYERSYDELKLGWTAPTFVEQIRFWLSETSRGTLHAPDQPLEPLFAGGCGSLILPPEFVQADESQPVAFAVQIVIDGAAGTVYVATRNEQAIRQGATRFVATAFFAQPSGHGTIRFLPQNLSELDSVAASAGLDILEGLRSRVGAWGSDANLLRSQLILVVVFPKTREAGSPVEVTDIWAFGTLATVSEIGEALALWQVDNRGFPGHLIGASLDRTRASALVLYPLIPHLAMTRAGAAAASGAIPDTRRIVGIGVGALGSQIAGILVRSGFGHWRFIDEDLFLPHNAARHELPHSMIGQTKARAMTDWVNMLLAESVAQDAIVADVLHPGDQAVAIAHAIVEADLIADFSANQAVARHLARDVEGRARRLSAFLNPSGTDVVVLAEDVNRDTPLDCIEMQYYRGLLDRPELRDHFAIPPGKIRVGRSCRDVSLILSGDLVTHHAAVASRGIRQAVEQDEAVAQIWTTDSDFNTRAVRVDVAPAVEIQVEGWRVVTDNHFIRHVHQLREAKLPLETGGVLLGTYDLQRNIAYVVATISAPLDSEECPESYIRGCDGLDEDVRNAGELTGSQLRYVGEWHSHPDGCSSAPSDDDHQLFSWLQVYMSRDGYPPVMLIVGETDLSWFVGSI